MILPLEQQVCSLESAKRLKELGVRQESLFYYCGGDLLVKTAMGYSTLGCESPSGAPDVIFDSEYDEYFDMKPVSAYTVAELGELLPTMGIMHVKSNNGRGADFWWSKYSHNGIKFITDGDTEAKARAKILIYLIENKLIEVRK